MYFIGVFTSKKKMSLLRNTFEGTRGRVIAGGLSAMMALTSLSPATAQDIATNQTSGVQTISTAPSNQNTAPDIESVDKRGAWLASKENGGTLVIWYDERNYEDAMSTVRSLQRLGKKNVTALAGRDDGGFVLVGNGRTGATVFTLREARDGTLGGEAFIFANQRNIAELDSGADDKPGRDIG